MRIAISNTCSNIRKLTLWGHTSILGQIAMDDPRINEKYIHTFHYINGYIDWAIELEAR